jgi:hypothetical protein
MDNGKWSHESGLNRRPTVYKTVALPLSYRGLRHFDNIFPRPFTIPTFLWRIFFIFRRDFFAETASFALQARRFDFMVGSSPKVIGYVFWR